MGRGSPLRFLLLLLVLFPLTGPAGAEPVGTAPSASQASQNPPTPISATTAANQDATPDTSLVDGSKSRTDSVIVVKHSFEHREQIITGSVVMTCLMLMMVAMNNYNPR
jgi:hypothetical protein